MFAFSRRFFLLISLVALVFSIPFAQAQPKPGPDKAPLRIGVSIDSVKVERWQTDLAVLQKRAKELGTEVLTETADGTDELQFQQAQKLLDSGIKVLVLIPHNTDTAARIVDAAKAKHIAVVDYDRLIRNSDVDCYVGFDPFTIGVLQASALVQQAPKGNYILMGGSPTDNNAQISRQGQMKVLKPFIDRGDIKIVADFWVNDWDPLVAYTRMSETLATVKGEVTAVVATNDGTAGGAIQALEEHKLAGKVLVSGQDADLAAILRILQGTQTMTVYKALAGQAARAAEAAVSLAKGEPLKTTSVIPNGKKDVPAILLPTVAVNKDNVKETVIKDGFQNVETIKQNLPKDKWPLIE